MLKFIIEPTNKLMEEMEQNGFRGNLFVGYLMFRESEKQTQQLAVADLKLLKSTCHDLIVNEVNTLLDDVAAYESMSKQRTLTGRVKFVTAEFEH